MTARIPTILTNRLTMRSLHPDDAEELHRVMHERDVLRFFPSTQPPSRERVSSLIARQIDHWREYGYGWWALEDRRTSAFVGWCGLQYLPETSEVEVAYLLGREYWGQGLATESAVAAVGYGFDEIGLGTIVALAHPDNTASQRVIEKLGMAFVDAAVYFGMTVRRYSLTRPSQRDTDAGG